MTHQTLTVTVLGAAGPTGLLTCLTALAAGYRVRAVSRRDEPLPLVPSDRLVQVRADAVSGEGLHEAMSGTDAVLSTLGCAYQRAAVEVYSAGTRNAVDALRAVGAGSRVVVVSSGLTNRPPSRGWIADRVVFPVLRDVAGRTLYEDMRRMEAYLQTVSDDIEWTIMRPGRLINTGGPSAYRIDPETPAGTWTARADLAAAMVAELSPASAHVHQAVAPTTSRRTA